MRRCAMAPSCGFARTGSDVTGEIGLGARGALGLVRHTGAPARIEEAGTRERRGARARRGRGVGRAGGRGRAAAGRRRGAAGRVRRAGAGSPLASADARERLLESRARLVRTADEERKRLERNLHDGAQQRLVSAQLTLRMLRRSRELDPIVAEIGLALEELRELARGLHPAALAAGSGGAIGALATRLPCPSSTTCRRSDCRRSSRSRSTTWSSEAIQNAVKHAEATAIAVTVRIDDAVVRGGRRRRPRRRVVRRLRTGRVARPGRGAARAAARHEPGGCGDDAAGANSPREYSSPLSVQPVRAYISGLDQCTIVIPSSSRAPR